MKTCNIDFIEVDYIRILYLMVYICGPVIAYLEYKTDLEILPFLMHFSEVLKRMLIIKYFVG